MLLTSVFVNNLKTALESLTWTSEDGGGTTSLLNVYTFPNWSNDGGYPFACILDNGSAIDISTNNETEGITTFEVHICGNYASIDEDTEADQREEVMLRLREVSDKFKEWLSNDTNFDSLLTTPNQAWVTEDSIFRADSITITEEYESELNLFRKVFTFSLNELIKMQNTI